MVKNLIIIGVIAGVIGLGIVGCRHGFSHNRSPEKKAEYIVAKISSKLDLDENQKTRLNKIKDEILEEAKPHRESKEEFRREAMELLRSDKITEEGVEKLVAKKEAAYKEMKPFIIKKIVEFHSILNTDQKNKLADKMEEFHRKYKRWPFYAGPG